MRSRNARLRYTGARLLLAIGMLFSTVGYAGQGVWTSGGPYGRDAKVLATNPATASTLYAGAWDGTPSMPTSPTVTWRGGAGELHWSNPENWDGGRVPGPSDIALFDALSPDALLDPQSTSVVGGLHLGRDFSGTLRLARDLTIRGDLYIGGGRLLGSGEPLWVDGVARVGGGLLETPRNVMRVWRLDIRGAGIVRVGASGRLELSGDGTPLTGDGLLDTTTNRPTSVEFTGHATSDLPLAGLAARYRQLGIAGHERDGDLRRHLSDQESARGERERLAFGDPETALTLYSGEKELVSAVIDPAGGFAYFGTQTYPGIIVKVRLSDFTRVGALTLNAGENGLQCAVIDPVGGFAYFGTSTSPGIVVKVRLSNFTRVGALTLNAGENSLQCAVIDPVGGFAYFGSSTSPGIVVKVRLADFTRVGALTLNSGENYLGLAVIDPAGGFAYFASVQFYSPGIIVKVRLSDFTRVGALTLNAGENGLQCAVIDPVGGFAYFGTWTSPGIVVKVRLSDFTRVGALTLNVGEDRLFSAVIDPESGFAYFGTSSPAIVKVRLSDFTRVGALPNLDGSSLDTAVIDTADGFAYFGTRTNPGIVVKVRLSDFTRAGALTLTPGENGLFSAVIDPGGGFAYFGTFTDPGIVVKVRLSDFTRVGALTLDPGEINLLSATIDVVGGFAYFGTYTNSSIVVKVRLSDFSRVGALPLNPGENYLRSAVIDPAGGFAYFGTSLSNPGIVVKIRLSDFTRNSALTLGSGEFNLNSAVIDSAAGFAYFGTLDGIVAKVRLSDFTRVGALTLDPGESGLHSAVIDPAAGFAYFGTYTSPGIVVKVRLSDFIRVGALTFNAGEDGPLCAVIDPAAGFAYFGVASSYWASVVKVRLTDMTRIGALRLFSGGPLDSAVIDPAAGFAYFGLGSWPGIVVRVDVSNAVGATAKVTGGGTICGGGSTAIWAALTGMAPWSLTWSDGVAQSDLMASPAIRGVSPAVTTVYSVTAVSDASGPGTASGSAVVTVISPIPVITAPGTVGAGSANRTASVPNHAGSTYAWTIGNGTITAGQGTSQISFTAGTAGTPLTLSVLETSVLGCPSAPGNATVTVAPSGSAVLFYTLAPCRQLDTRGGGTPLTEGATLTVALIGAPCGIPGTAKAVSVNLTVTEPTAAGFLTIFPADETRPLISNINFTPGQTRANNAALRLSTDGTGSVKVFNGSLGTTHIILDVNGFFE